MDESDNVLQSSEAVGVCVEDRVQQIVFQDSGNEVTMWSVVVSVVRYRVEYMDRCCGVFHSLSSFEDLIPGGWCQPTNEKLTIIQRKIR